ncbi:hypothetical protein NHQ30_001255 [Ciborinia camelliae]|nr:hypothetical protein NHQ30_001255 [Ciborinia camelliae]
MTTFSNTNTRSLDGDPYKTQNLDSPTLREKVEDLNTFIAACKFGMMTTRDAKTGALFSRCMAVAAKEDGGTTLLFHTNTESGKTDDLATDSHVNISFLNSSGEWASISGISSITTSPPTIQKYYTPTLQAWLGDLGDGTHDGGTHDPRIGMIKVEAKTATYALVRKSLLARGVEMASSVVTGQAASVNRLREISEGEMQTWRTSVGMGP